MIWLTWRQFRTQSLVTAALLAAAAVYLLVTGTQLRSAYTADLTACRPANAAESCFGLLNALQDQYNGPLELAEFLVMAAPALIGVFWGAPLLAGELERGTHSLAWNQSVTRTRWLAAKLGLTALATVLTAGVLSLLMTWYASPLDTAAGNRWGTRSFNARDVVPLGYAAFAFALGVTAGLLIRRSVPAMAATLAIFIAVQVPVTALLRPHVLPAKTVSTAIDQSSMSQAIRFDRAQAVTGQVQIDLPGPAGAWILSESPALDSAGRAVPTSEVLDCWNRVLSPSAVGKAGTPGFGQLGSCLAPLDLHVDTTYQPAGRYWPLQWTETGFYLLLAGGLTVFCFRRVHRIRA